MSEPYLEAIQPRSKSQQVTGVIGELLLTLGVLIGLFLAWHLVWNDAVQGQIQNQSAASFARDWRSQTSNGIKMEQQGSAAQPSDVEPPVTESPAEGQAFALLYVPRFGADYVKTIGEGVDLITVLNSNSLGVGRYPQSDQLGQIGNFALAAHRTTWGAPFGNIGELRIGDRMYVEVPEGWYSFSFRNLEYVWASEVAVLDSFPKMSLEAENTRVITLISCHPKFTISERIIAYGLFDGWYPRAQGAPSEIAKIVQSGS
jgi:sortase A